MPSSDMVVLEVMPRAASRPSTRETAGGSGASCESRGASASSSCRCEISAGTPLRVTDAGDQGSGSRFTVTRSPLRVSKVLAGAGRCTSARALLTLRRSVSLERGVSCTAPTSAAASGCVAAGGATRSLRASELVIIKCQRSCNVNGFYNVARNFKEKANTHGPRAH
jgi:hypothetical protein